MFGNHIKIEDYKNIIFEIFKEKELCIEHESKKIVIISFNIVGNKIRIKISVNSKTILLDISDAFGITRIPAMKFKDTDNFRNFIIENVLPKTQ